MGCETQVQSWEPNRLGFLKVHTYASSTLGADKFSSLPHPAGGSIPFCMTPGGSICTNTITTQVEEYAAILRNSWGLLHRGIS